MVGGSQRASSARRANLHGDRHRRLLRIVAATDFDTLYTVVLLMTFFAARRFRKWKPRRCPIWASTARGTGRVRVWGSIGFIAAVLIIGYMLDVLEIRVLLWIMLAILGATPVPDAGARAAQCAHAHDHTPIAHIIRQPQVIALIVACALMVVAHGPYYTFYSIHLVGFGYSKGAVGWMWSLGVICEIAIFFWMAHLFRAFTLRQVLIASFALAGIRFAIIALCADNLALLLLAQTLHAASFGSFHAAALGYVHRFFRGRNQARGQAIYTSLTFGLGGTVGSLYSGYAWEHFGAVFTFAGAALCAFAGMLILWRGLDTRSFARRGWAAACWIMG